MPFALKALAEQVGGELDGPGDLLITGVAGIREARAGELTFVASPRYLPYLDETLASAVILADGVRTKLPCLRVADPYLAFLRAIQAFSKPVAERFAVGIHPSAIVDSTAELGEGVRVGACAVVGRGCRIGPHTIIGPSAVLMDGVSVGQRCLIYPHVTIREECELGDRVILQPGCVIGSDGFGYAKDKGAYHKIPQIGKVVIEDDVEIGANACIDRATTGRTVVGAGSKIDNLVQIAHNVTIGRGTILSAQVGIAGSTKVGDQVVMAGQVGAVGHINIGDGARIGAQSGISKDVPAGAEFFGYPAREHREFKRLHVHINRLPRYAEQLERLRRRVEELEKTQGAQATTNS
jgi:UDP-3-O-[3-hydroxymyristoyl] glucosamine N-acyltransferase